MGFVFTPSSASLKFEFAYFFCFHMCAMSFQDMVDHGSPQLPAPCSAEQCLTLYHLICYLSAIHSQKKKKNLFGKLLGHIKNVFPRKEKSK